MKERVLIRNTMRSIHTSLTVVELVIAIILLGVVVLAAFSFNVASHTMMQSSERRVEVINEMTFVLDHIHRNVLEAVPDQRSSLGIGMWGSIAEYDAATNILTLRIRQMPRQASGDVVFPGTMAEIAKVTGGLADPQEVQYVFDPGNHEIRFINAAADTVVLTNRLHAPAMMVGGLTIYAGPADVAAGFIDTPGEVRILNLDFRYDPTAGGISSRENPSVVLNDTSFYPSTLVWRN